MNANAVTAANVQPRTLSIVITRRRVVKTIGIATARPIIIARNAVQRIAALVFCDQAIDIVAHAAIDPSSPTGMPMAAGNRMRPPISR